MSDTQGWWIKMGNGFCLMFGQEGVDSYAAAGIGPVGGEQSIHEDGYEDGYEVKIYPCRHQAQQVRFVKTLPEAMQYAEEATK